MGPGGDWRGRSSRFRGREEGRIPLVPLLYSPKLTKRGRHRHTVSFVRAVAGAGRTPFFFELVGLPVPTTREEPESDAACLGASDEAPRVCGRIVASYLQRWSWMLPPSSVPLAT